MGVNDFIKRATKTEDKNLEIPEANIENAFVKYAKKKGCNPVKLVFLAGRGWPDRTVLCPGGRIFFIEFKRKGKTLEPKQILVRKMLEGLGFEYHMCDEIGQAEQILDLFLTQGL